MKTLLMGIDIGTSACKVTLYNLDQKTKISVDSKYPVYYPRTGWVEQNPDEWWDAVCNAVCVLIKDHNLEPREIAGIGIAGQSWSAIPLDHQGKILHNTPIWMDTRASDICLDIRERVNEDHIFKLSGNPLQPAYTLPKILWFKKHLPELYQKTGKFLQSNSYIGYKLTGIVAQDLSQGYGLQCFNMHNGTWDLGFCEEIGLRTDLLPELVPCHQVIGTVTAEASKQTGLAFGTPVVAGGLDAACGALGAGVIKPGETQEQGGQAGGMSICMDKYTADLRLILGFHVVPDRWLLQGGTTGGGSLRWLAQECMQDQNRTLNSSITFQKINAEAEKIAPGCEGLVFLPYMAGERSPIWDEKAKGVIYGLDYSKTRSHLMRASMEGVAFSLRHNLDTAESIGVPVEVLRSVGGATKSKLWMQIKADVTGKKLIVPTSREATTLGAAILAGVGTKVFSGFETAVSSLVEAASEYLPNAKNRQIYNHNYKIYLDLYRRLEETMHLEETLV